MSPIRINLLPHRQMRKARQQRWFAIIAAMVLGLGLAVVAGGQAYLVKEKSDQDARNAFLKDEIAKLEQNSLDCTNEAIALKKDYFDAYVLKGQLLGSYGQIEQQQKWLDTTIKTFPQIAPADITQEMGM